MTRGLVLNNPFNLEISNRFQWEGEIRPTQDPEKVLCQFDSMDRGLRAGFKNLINQCKLDGLDTWGEIIPKYAPPTENDTAAYIAAMVKGTGFEADDTLPMSDPSFLALAGKTLIIHEQGFNPFSPEQLAGPINAALTT